jgi:hypothetical protein
MSDLAARLRLVPTRLGAALEGLSPDECESKPCADEESIRWCVAHIASAALGWSDMFYEAVEDFHDTPRASDKAWKDPLLAHAASTCDAALEVYRRQAEAVAALLETFPADDFARKFKPVAWLTEPFQINESVNWGLVIHCDFHLSTIHKLRTALGKPLDWMTVYSQRFPREQ